MRRLGFLLLLLSTPALADSITIGTFTYVGTNPQGLSTYQAVFNSGVTAEPLFFPVVVLGFQFGAQTLGPFDSSNTITLGPGPGILNCPCSFVSFTPVLSQSSPTFTFLLANGQLFNALSASTSIILPLPGETLVQPGQSVPITLTAVPEPSTALLVGIGLTILIVIVRWKPRTATPGASSAFR
jgi:hypothetical protein